MPTRAAHAVEHLGIGRRQLLKVLHEALVFRDGIEQPAVRQKILGGFLRVGVGGGLVGFQPFLQSSDAVVLDGNHLLASTGGTVTDEGFRVEVVLEVGVSLFERDRVQFHHVFQQVDVCLHGGEHLERLVGLLLPGIYRDELHRTLRANG